MNKIASIIIAAIIAASTSVTTSASPVPDHYFAIGNKTITASSEQSSRSVTINGKYNTLKVSRGIIINLTAGTGQPTAKISGPKNLVELTDVSVKDGDLIVNYSQDFNVKGKNVVVEITGTLPNEYKVSAGGVININSSIEKPGEIEVKVSAGGSVNFNNRVKADTLEASVSAGGEVNINGTTEIKTGDFKTSAGGELTIQQINAEILDLKTSAGGEITIKGNAKKASAKTSAGGVINARNLVVDSWESIKSSAGGEIKIK